MAKHLEQYTTRADRYTLHLSDEPTIRFSTNHKIVNENAGIVNISFSGLAFTTKITQLPDIDEIIKIQFLIPEGQQIACHARVTRIEKHDTQTHFIALSFEHLNIAHRIALKNGLSKGLKNQKERQIFKSLQDHSQLLLLYIMTTLSMMSFFFILQGFYIEQTIQKWFSQL